MERTPHQARLASQTIRTKDLVDDPNKFPQEIQDKFAELVKKDSDFQFTAGYDANANIIYINLFDHLFLFRRTGLNQKDNFETFEIVPSISSGLLNVKPIFFKTYNITMVLYFDASRVLISSLVDGRFLAAIEVSKNQAELESVSELNQTSKALELVILDSAGNVHLLEIKADLSYKMTTLENQSGTIRNMLSSVFSKSEPSNKIKADVLTHRTKKTSHIVKFFENKISEAVYDSNFSIENRKRSRNLHEHIRQWDLNYLNKNKLVHTDSRTVAYIPVTFEKFETIFICVYNLYVMNYDSIEIVITKARTIKYTQDQLECLSDIVIREEKGSMYDLVDIKGFMSGNDIYIAYSFFDCEKGQHCNSIYITDRFFRHLTRKDYDQRVFGCGIAETDQIALDTGFFAILDNKLVFLDEEAQKSFIKSRFVEHSDLKFDFETHQPKRVHSSNLKGSMISEVNFTKHFEHLFSLFLNKQLDTEFDEYIAWIRESITEQDYTNDLKQFMYHIVEERNRNLILAIRLIKEDLSVVEERKKELGHFDDIITIELKKKLKKLEKLDELLQILNLGHQYKLLRTENAALRDAVHTALAIRSKQREMLRNEEITKFFDRIFSILAVRYRIDASDNYDVFYTNLINIQSFFATFNDILVSDIEQEKDITVLGDVIKVGLSIYSQVISGLYTSKKANNTGGETFISTLIREDNNLLAYLVKLVTLVIENDYLKQIRQDQCRDITNLITQTITYLYEIKDYLYVQSISQDLKTLFEALIELKEEKIALELALK